MSCGVGCRRGSDPALLWLWCRPVATAPIGPLAWEPPYAAGAAQEIATTTTTTKEKRQKKKKKKKSEPNLEVTQSMSQFLLLMLCVLGSVCQEPSFSFSFFFAISWAAPAQGSQAKGLIGAIATRLHQSHSNAGSEPCLQPTPQLTATLDPWPTEQGQGWNLQPHGSYRIC